LNKLKLSFSRQSRLLNAKAYKNVMSEPSFRVSSKYLVILAKNNDLTFPRLGLIASKKNVRKAVSRNQIKRLTREYFRLHQFEFNALDIVVIIKHGLDVESKVDIREQIKRTWTKVKLIPSIAK
jgi:ribonuclease P protein component